MVLKILTIICGILATIHVLNVFIHLWLLRRRKYAIVPRCGYDATDKCINWENINEECEE